jgi:hypothetical protein
MNARLQFISAAMLTVLGAACSNSSGPPQVNAGNYDLQGVNNAPLPDTVWIYYNTAFDVVVSGSFDLRSNGSYTKTFNVIEHSPDVPPGPEHANSESGTYAIVGTGITITPNDGNLAYTGTVADGDLIYSVTGFSPRFHRN